MKGRESLAEVKLKYDYDCAGKNSGKENDYYSKLNIFKRERERGWCVCRLLSWKSAGLIVERGGGILWFLVMFQQKMKLKKGYLFFN